ncbi:MAG: phosphoserine aminotransferase, partial [Parvicella sp.]
SILSKPIDVSLYGAVYAGAQKNIGPAGLTIMIIREDLLERGDPNLSPILSYQHHAKADSMLNTPPTYSWYIAGLVFEWLKALGGIERISTLNNKKANLLYSAIDQSGFYHNPIQVTYRSRMNIPFTLTDSQLESIFLAEAKCRGLANLKGHRSVGGMRASIYNAMPIDGVKALIGFMQDFEKQYG